MIHSKKKSALSLSLLLCCGGLHAEEGDFAKALEPFLQQHCVRCHGPEKSKGSFRVDELSMRLARGEDADQWEEMLHRLQRGEMPPEEEEDQPRPEEVIEIADLINKQFQLAAADEHNTGGEVVLRRLNADEYNNTIADLLGIEFRAGDFFPEDSDEGGFDNIGQFLHTSPVLMRAYLDAADSALNEALWFDAKPEYLKKRFDTKEVFGYGRPGSNFGVNNGHLEIRSFWSQQSVDGRDLEIKTPGKYRVKIKAYGVRSPEETLKLEVMVGILYKQDTIRHAGVFYLPNDETFEIEEEIFLRPKDAIKVQWLNGKKNTHAVREAREKGIPYVGPAVVLESVEVEGPLFLDEGWPKRSHRLALGSKEPAELTADDVPDLIGRFASRAFRRPAEAADVEPIVNLVLAEIEAGVGIEESLRTGLKTVLCSPKFLFMYEADGPLDDYMIASRLSYFLWSSMPDDELIGLAEAGRLKEPEALRNQVTRMLQDPKARRFTESFVGQWLDLRKIGEMIPDRAIYPSYNQELEDGMKEETFGFFDELLANNLSVDQFLNSDFLMVNEVMAKHYGIEGVSGQHFRRVPVPEGSRRGGILAHASVLNVTSNGTSTSPVVRGAWVMERILGVTPPPPPPDVPVVVPDIRGATTIREQMAKHRSVQACNGCHRKIDPLGFGLESFDVVGQWRTNYRVRKGPVDGNGWYGDGPEVDAADRLHTGEEFDGFESLRSILMSRREEFHRCLTREIMTYALGRKLQWSDRETVDELTGRLKQPGYGLRDLVTDIVLTKQFSSR